jgi:hypothetical protein
MFLPKDSFRARILNHNTLGWLNFAHRAVACKRGPDQPACNGATPFRVRKYGYSAADSCVSEARPQLRRNSVAIIVRIRI